MPGPSGIIIRRAGNNHHVVRSRTSAVNNHSENPHAATHDARRPVNRRQMSTPGQGSREAGPSSLGQRAAGDGGGWKGDDDDNVPAEGMAGRGAVPAPTNEELKVIQQG